MTSNRNRTPTGQIRDDFLLETNFDDDGALTRAYNTLPQQQQGALQRRSIPYRSNLSVDRYSETTLHGKPPRKGIYSPGLGVMSLRVRSQMLLLLRALAVVRTGRLANRAAQMIHLCRVCTRPSATSTDAP